MIPASAITDHERVLFLRKLAENQRGENPLLVSPWEANFINSFRAASRQSLWFTEPRRVAAG